MEGIEQSFAPRLKNETTSGTIQKNTL